MQKPFSKSGILRRLLQLLLAGTIALFASIPGLRAQPVKVIVPIPPGASLDIMTRVLADQIARAQGLTMVVENRPGADTIIGTEAVARAAPDGKTLLAAATGFVINPLLRKTNYDPLRSFEPICKLASLPTIIAVSSKSRYFALADLFNAARAQPGRLTLASIGPGSTTQLAFEELKREAKVDMTFVPYPGSAPAFDAVLGQQVTAYFGESSFVRAQIRAGTLRALAVAAPRRLDALPEVPTLAELGFTNVRAELWLSILAPAKTIPQTTDHFAALFSAALQAPEVKAKFGNLGIYPARVCGADFANFLREQLDEDRRIIQEAGIKTD
jgi:tripartite-type tricarboxylate transporter receptor subunit TctC